MAILTLITKTRGSRLLLTAGLMMVGWFFYRRPYLSQAESYYPVSNSQQNISFTYINSRVLPNVSLGKATETTNTSNSKLTQIYKKPHQIEIQSTENLNSIQISKNYKQPETAKTKVSELKLNQIPKVVDRNEIQSEIHSTLPKFEVSAAADKGAQRERFHIIITFRLINYTGNQKAHARMMEYVECLNLSLNNPNVKQVHLMYDSSDMTGFIQENVGHHPKLLLHKVQSPDVVLTLHEFAFTHLQGEVVVITQADIILGEGFEKVSKQLLLEKRLMYSLSRQPSHCGKEYNQCLNYIGSHDMFVFVPQGSLNSEATRLLSHNIFSWGTENVVLHVYQNVLKYRILNPCRLLKIYHLHCSGYRTYMKEQQRVNIGVSVIKAPTDKLV